jgi:hypothetical protein
LHQRSTLSNRVNQYRPDDALAPARSAQRADHAPLTAGMTGFAGIMLIITGVLRLLIIALDLFVIWTLIASRHDSSLS